MNRGLTLPVKETAFIIHICFSSGRELPNKCTSVIIYSILTVKPKNEFYIS